MKIGFIGTGNMGSAMMGGIISAGMVDASDVMASDIFQAALDKDLELKPALTTEMLLNLQILFFLRLSHNIFLMPLMVLRIWITATSL